MSLVPGRGGCHDGLQDEDTTGVSPPPDDVYENVDCIGRQMEIAHDKLTRDPCEANVNDASDCIRRASDLTVDLCSAIHRLISGEDVEEWD